MSARVVTRGVAAAALLAASAPAARGQLKPTIIAPRYRGESICLGRPGICHDEVVVYHMSPVKGDATRYDIAANKIVHGVEEPMGVIPCRLAGATLRCEMPQGTWLFAVRGDSLVGGLTLTDGTPMRRVRVKASSNSRAARLHAAPHRAATRLKPSRAMPKSHRVALMIHAPG